MIEVRIVPAEAKKSGAIYGAYVKGAFCVVNDRFTSANITAMADGSHKASLGEIRLALCTGGTAQNTNPRMAYPIDALVFAPENSETSYDTMVSGDRVIYYTEGTFATNCYDTTISGETTLGTKLYVNTTGWLTATEAGYPVAELVAYDTVGTTTTFNGTALYAKDLITYRLL